MAVYFARPTGLLTDDTLPEDMWTYTDYIWDTSLVPAQAIISAIGHKLSREGDFKFTLSLYAVWLTQIYDQGRFSAEYAVNGH